MSTTLEVTKLLADWANGKPEAFDELMPLVYTELRRLAASFLRGERPDHTLQPTALVHEAYLRLVDQRNSTWQNRAHFFGVGAHLMREILVDHARRRQAGKRHGRKVSLDHAVTLGQERGADLVALDAALTALEKFDVRKSKVVELRYFGGFSVEEIAKSLDVAVITVRRDLKMAEAWLRREMKADTPAESHVHP